MATVVCQRWLYTPSNKILFSVHGTESQCASFRTAKLARDANVLVTVGFPSNLEVRDPIAFDTFLDAPQQWLGSQQNSAGAAFSLPQSQEKPMSEEPKKRSTKDAVKSAGKNAVKRTTVRATNKALANLVLDKTGLSKKYPILMTKKGRTAFEVLVPIALHAIAANADVPKAEFVVDALEESMTVAMTDGLGAITDELVEALLPFWGEVIAILMKKKGPLGLPEGEEPVRAQKQTVGADPVEV